MQTTSTKKKKKKKTKRDIDEALQPSQHQGRLYGEDDDPNDALNLLPAGIAAQIIGIPSEDERTASINAYLNSRLSLLPELVQQEVLAFGTMEERITRLLAGVAIVGDADDNLEDEMMENL